MTSFSLVAAIPPNQTGRRRDIFFANGSSMNVEVIQPTELTAELLARWDEIQSHNAALSNPYFRPEYVQAIGRLRNDVEIAVLEQDGEPSGFFAYQRDHWNGATPVGGRISDYQGVIAAPDLQWTADELLKQARLRGFRFDHLLASQSEWSTGVAKVHDSPCLDLSGGFEEYRNRRRQQGCVRIKQFLSKLRKLEREVGPVRFVPFTDDGNVFEQLIAWKSAQYHHAGLANLFRLPNVTLMLKELLKEQGPKFKGTLTALYAGETLAAVAYSLVGGGVWHICFPAYNFDLEQYSPGALLITRLAQEASQLGITQIDLGKGEAKYKTVFATSAVRVAEGSLDRSPMMRGFQSLWLRTRDLVKSSPLYAPAKRPLRWLRETLDWLAYR
jgi:CelD/BcsL family acetyltransferase involved in cellulose biosynthesis